MMLYRCAMMLLDDATIIECVFICHEAVCVYSYVMRLYVRIQDCICYVMMLFDDAMIIVCVFM